MPYPTPSWAPPQKNFTVTVFIEGCSTPTQVEPMLQLTFHKCLLWLVSLPLWYTEKRFGSLSQKCLLSNLWLSRLHSPAVASRITHSYSPPCWKSRWTIKHLPSMNGALRLPADNFPLQQLASRTVQPRLNKRPSWRSFC